MFAPLLVQLRQPQPTLTFNYRLYAVEPSLGKDDYHLTTDIADRAIDYITGIKSATPDRPFFGYFATGAVHAPHHAPDSVGGQPMAVALS